MARAMAADLAGVPGGSAYGVVARSQPSAETFGHEFAARVFPSLEEMLADGDIDLIYVNSPNHLHYPQVRQALDAGKPVLCEKPFTLNSMQLAELIALARAKQLFLMEAMWVRFLPAVARLRTLLADGSIGALEWMQASFHSKPPRDASNRFYDLSMGGDALLDLGIYPVSFASMVFGAAPRQIVSSATLAETGVDEKFGALFEYPHGGRAAISAGFGGNFADEIVLLGSAGQIRMPRFAGWKLDQLIIEDGGNVEDVRHPVTGKGYGYQAAEAMRCLETGVLESPIIPLDESLAIMKTLDTLRAQWGMVFPGEAQS